MHVDSALRQCGTQRGTQPTLEDIYSRYANRILSAISAMNSELVGFPFPVLIVYPNSASNVSILIFVECYTTFSCCSLFEAVEVATIELTHTLHTA